jgi:cytochrome b561
MKISTKRRIEKIVRFIDNKILPWFMLIAAIGVVIMVCMTVRGCVKHKDIEAQYTPQYMKFAERDYNNE